MPVPLPVMRLASTTAAPRVRRIEAAMVGVEVRRASDAGASSCASCDGMLVVRHWPAKRRVGGRRPSAWQAQDHISTPSFAPSASEDDRTTMHRQTGEP
jgi:hypothetical protein